MNTSTILQTILNKGRHLLLCLMLLTISINHIQAEEVTYTFTTKAWAEETGTWTSNNDGSKLITAQGVQITTTTTGAGAISKKFFSNVSKISIIYSTNASSGAGTINVQIGENTSQSLTLTKEGGATDRTLDITFSPKQSGNITFTVNCTTNSIYIKSITITYSPYGGQDTEWVETDIANITPSDIVVIAMTKGATTWALANDNGTSSAPTAVALEINKNKLKYDPANTLKWNINNSNGELIIYSNGYFNKWLYCTNTNGDGVRVGGTNSSNTFKITDNYLQHVATSRFVGVYPTKPDWRCYDNNTGNIKGQTLKFYKKSIVLADDRAEANLSWSTDAVELLVGAPFTAPTLNNPNRLEGITFTSNNESLATVSNTGAITLLPDVAGTATITATYAGNETHKDAEVSCTITVNPIIENVVILAQYDGKYYAMKAEYVDDTQKNTLRAVEVEIINGIIYNVDNETSITWQRSVVGNKATFKNGEKYLTGDSEETYLKLASTACQWTYDGNHSYTIGERTFLCSTNGFKNYKISNAGNKGYSTFPVVIPAKIENATITKRENTTVGHYGTICMPYNIPNYTGATFYEVAGKEDNKIIFDQVTELEAGMPYIFLAEATEIKLVHGNEIVTEPKSHNGLVGSFTQIDPAENNALTGNYIVYQNVIQKCGQNCGMLENRAYFKALDLEALAQAPAPVQGRRRVTMNKADETTTAVDNITENGTIAPAMQGTYDIMGRSITEPTASGFYIINGKKVFVVK